MDQETLFQVLAARYDLVIKRIPVGADEVMSLLAVRDVDVLLDQIDPEEFKRDERLPYWAEIWPAGIGLARYLVTYPIKKDERVMDLGCGLGLVGITAAKLGAKVMMCDYEQAALEFARYSAGLNGVTDRITFRQIDWRSPDLKWTFQTIMGGDILYEPDDLDHIEALAGRVLEPGGVLLMSDPERKLGETFVAQLKNRGYRHRKTRMSVDFEGCLGENVRTMTCTINVHRLVKPDI